MLNREVDLDVRAKSSDILLASASFLKPVRRFGQMTPEEKQAVIVSVLSDGLFGDIDLKIGTVPVVVQGAVDELHLTAQLPVEPALSEWDIYKVWRARGQDEVAVEKEHVLSSGPLLTFGMAPRENTLQDAVLVHSRSGTVLICQVKDGPKS